MASQVPFHYYCTQSSIMLAWIAGVSSTAGSRGKLQCMNGSAASFILIGEMKAPASLDFARTSMTLACTSENCSNSPSL